MGVNETFKKAIDNLIQALKSGNIDVVSKEKYNVLWDVNNLFELITNYLFLDKIGISFDFGSDIIKSGTKLFRIREYKDYIDYSNLKEWEPSPYRAQNRANKQGKEALYLGSTETVCFLETRMKAKDIYVIGTYECKEDIKVGGFLNTDNKNILHTLASIVLNAFLIAPSRCDKTIELFLYLDKYFGALKLNDINLSKNELLTTGAIKLPYMFAVLNQNTKLYELTNKLYGILEKKNQDGVRYSSCYIPLEAPGIECSEYNIVLYTSGISKLRFIDYNIKSYQIKNIDSFSDINIAKILLGDI